MIDMKAMTPEYEAAIEAQREALRARGRHWLSVTKADLDWSIEPPAPKRPTGARSP